MLKLDSLRVLALRAVGLIRRRGFSSFLHRLVDVRSWLPDLLSSGALTEFPAYDATQLAGAVDAPLNGIISRGTGQIDGWAIGRSDMIDTVQILVDGAVVGNASLCLPRWDIPSDSPEAAVCGFRIYLRPDQMPEGSNQLQVQFVVNGLSGQTRVFPPRSIALAPAAGPIATPLSPDAAAPRRRRREASQKPKLVCFTHSLEYGGAQLYMQELLRRIAARGEVDCLVCSPQRGPLKDELKALGLAVHILQEPSTVNAERHDRATEALGCWLVENQVDCALANTLAGFYAVNAATGVGLPSIWAIHESFPLSTWTALYTHERPGSEFLLSRIETALRRTSAAIFESEATRRLFMGYGTESRFMKVPYGIDVAHIDGFLRSFDRRRAREAVGIPPNSRVLLCMGTIEARKQQIFLAQAFLQSLAMHGEAILLLVGDHASEYSSALHRYLEVKNVGQKVRIIPITPDPFSWYGIADAFVLLSATESMPRSIMEAMAFRLPVLATGAFGIPELIDDGISGFLVETNSLRSAVEGLNKLLSLSEDEHTFIGGAARRKVELEHDSRGYAEAYLSLVRRLTPPT